MTYRLDRGLFVENGPALHAAKVASAHNFVRFGAWRNLDTDRRFDMVQKALSAPANDLVDSYPVAL
jgi:hypothetical protein